MCDVSVSFSGKVSLLKVVSTTVVGEILALYTAAAKYYVI